MKENNETKEDIVKILPDEEVELTEEQIKSKKLYFSAEYIKKEVNGEILYNKLLTTTTEKHSIVVLGFMPENAEIKVTEVNIEEAENKINEKNLS